ncbi:hypothetical protein Tco_0074155 [Tanacetum coccineum]
MRILVSTTSGSPYRPSFGTPKFSPEPLVSPARGDKTPSWSKNDSAQDLRCKKMVECVACLLGRWDGFRGTGSTFDQHVCVINQRRVAQVRNEANSSSTCFCNSTMMHWFCYGNGNSNRGDWGHSRIITGCEKGNLQKSK